MNARFWKIVSGAEAAAIACLVAIIILMNDRGPAPKLDAGATAGTGSDGRVEQAQGAIQTGPAAPGPSAPGNARAGDSAGAAPRREVSLGESAVSENPDVAGKWLDLARSDPARALQVAREALIKAEKIDDETAVVSLLRRLVGLVLQR